MDQEVELYTKWDELWLNINNHTFTRLANGEEYFVNNGGNGKDYRIIKTEKQVFIWKCTIDGLNDCKFLFVVRLYSGRSIHCFHRDNANVTECLYMKLSTNKYLYIGGSIYIFKSYHGKFIRWWSQRQPNNPELYVFLSDKQYTYCMNKLIYGENKDMEIGFALNTINKYPTKDMNGKQLKIPINKMKVKLLDPIADISLREW